MNIEDYFIKEEAKTPEGQEELTNKRTEKAWQFITDAQEMTKQKNVNIGVVSLDEKTAIQALSWQQSRNADGSTSRDCKYGRHGTTNYIGFFDVTEGKAILPAYLTGSYKEENLVEAATSMINQNPTFTKLFVISDNYGTHKSESLVKLCAQVNGDPPWSKGEIWHFAECENQRKIPERSDA